VLFSEIDFTHPVFAAFADPRFGDFTKVRFWKHQGFELQSEAKARVVSRFDDGTPALWEQPVGSGRAFVFASSWRPADSQLALSSKFVPLLSSLLNQAAGLPKESASSISVGDPVSLPEPASGSSTVVVGPDGAETTLVAGERTFAGTNVPGIYQLKVGSEAQRFAVNLPPGESDTTPFDKERLEQLGVRMGSMLTAAERTERAQQLRDIELESRQKLWQWLIVGAITILGVETFVAGRATKKQEQQVTS
jgi:hypothetical protein